MNAQISPKKSTSPEQDTENGWALTHRDEEEEACTEACAAFTAQLSSGKGVHA